MNLDFWDAGDVLAAQQDRCLERVISRPRVIPIAERMLKTLQYPIQVQPQIVIFFHGISGPRRPVVQVVVIGRLSLGVKIDLFKFRVGGTAKEKSSFVDLPDAKKRIGARAVLRDFELPAHFEEALLGGL